MSTTRRLRRSNQHAFGAWAAALFTTAWLATGCTTSSASREASGSQSHEPSTTAGATADRAATNGRTPSLEQLEQQFAIGPLTADALGYRIDWRVATGVENLRLFSAQNDSVYLLDGGNFLNRFRADDGIRLWRAPVAEPVEEIFAVTDLADDGLVLVTTPGAVLEIDRAAGGLLGRQKLAKIANTEPALFGQFLVYGARNGQIIWHSYPVKFQWRATQVSQSINVPPVIRDGIAAVVGNGGQVMVLDADRARAIWNTRLLDTVVAPPVIRNGVLYVAGLDQHIRAFDIRNGRALWKVLTKSPLRESPIVTDNRLYQQIPGTGLVCYDALPLDSPGGKEIWTAADVTGSVLTVRGRDLLTWNPQTKTLQTVDATYGTLKETMTLSGAQHLMCTSLNDGTLYAVSNNGTISRLVTKN